MSERIGDKQKLLDKALISGNFIFASGAKARLKFDFDKIGTGSEEWDIAVNGLAGLIRENFHNIDAIVTVANGAIRLGDPIATDLAVVHIPTARTDTEPRQFSVPGLIPEGVERVVIVDDVYTKGTNSTKVNDVLARQGLEAIGVVVVLDRSEDAHIPASPLYSIVKQYIETYE